MLYDYERRNPNELSLKRNDIVLLRDRDPSGWWKGEAHGEIGLFPGNYCVLLGSDNVKRLSDMRSSFIQVCDLQRLSSSDQSYKTSHSERHMRSDKECESSLMLRMLQDLQDQLGLARAVKPADRYFIVSKSRDSFRKVWSLTLSVRDVETNRHKLTLRR